MGEARRSGRRSLGVRQGTLAPGSTPFSQMVQYAVERPSARWRIPSCDDTGRFFTSGHGILNGLPAPMAIDASFAALGSRAWPG